MYVSACDYNIYWETLSSVFYHIRVIMSDELDLKNNDNKIQIQIQIILQCTFFILPIKLLEEVIKALSFFLSTM